MTVAQVKATFLQRAAPALLGIGAVFAPGLSGCEKKEDAISVYQAPKPPVPVNVASMGSAARPDASANSMRLGSARSGGEQPVKWTAPAGWKQLPASEMRYAAFEVAPENPAVVLTVIPVSPSPLLANVNRWEGQLKLPPSSAEQVEKSVRHMDLADGEHADIVDLIGPEPTAGVPRQRMLAALVDHGTAMWSFKLVGPADVVAAQKDNFDAFVKSLRFDDGSAGETLASQVPAGDAQAAPTGEPGTPGKAAGLAYVAPAGWAIDPTPRQMRLLTFTAGSGQEKAEFTVVRLARENAGGGLDNINRWRGQVGLEPVATFNAGDAQMVRMGDAGAAVFDFAGPTPAAPEKRLLVAMALRGNDIWFFKLIGAPAAVAAQEKAFYGFLKSVQFAE